MIENERKQNARDREESDARHEAKLIELKRKVSERYEQYNGDQSKALCLHSPSNAQGKPPVSIFLYSITNIAGANPSIVSPSYTTLDISRHPNPMIGTFTTDEIRYWFHLTAQTCKSTTFARPYLAAPGLALGLTSVHMRKQSDARIKAYASDVRADGFVVHLDSWSDTMLFNAACTWMEIEGDDPDFQFGNYNTHEYQLSKKPVQVYSRLIVFARPYETPPCVVVWLASFDIKSENHWRIRTYATEITTTGFRIHVNTWDDTVLHCGGATWVAYTAGKPGVGSGSFSSGDHQPKRSITGLEEPVQGLPSRHGKGSGSFSSGSFSSGSLNRRSIIRSDSRAKRSHTGHEAFPKGLFATCPRVVVALSELDVACSRFLRVRVKTSELSVDGMDWQLEGWVDTDVEAASASYIAMW